jgi:hypothetical protein
MGVNTLICEGAVQAGHVVLTERRLVVRVLGVVDICNKNDIQKKNKSIEN